MYLHKYRLKMAYLTVTNTRASRGPKAGPGPLLISMGSLHSHFAAVTSRHIFQKNVLGPPTHTDQPCHIFMTFARLSGMPVRFGDMCLPSC